MTNVNYTQMSNGEFLKTILGLSDVPHLVNHLRKNHPNLYLELERRVESLETDLETTPISAIIYCFQNGIDKIPTCANGNCANHVKWNKKAHCFRQYCSRTCSGKSPIVQKHREENFLLRNGVENPFELEAVKDKIRKTMLEEFGVDNPSKSYLVREKRKRTNLERMGVECSFQSEEVKRKICDSNMKRFGVQNPFQSERVRAKHRESCILAWGVEFPTQLKEIKRKVVETNRRKYGCDYYSQSSDYHGTAHKPYVNAKYPDMTFGSSWEFKVYDFLIENHLTFEYQPFVSFPYAHNGKVHTYHPDFKVGDNLFEVKGDQFFNESGQMVNPYDHSQDELYESKHQCMIANHVIILRGKDVENLSIGLFNGKQSMT